MNINEAYKMVYEDMVNSGCGLLVGKFDANNGTEKFMYGIQTVMEWIADRATSAEAFDAIWMKNFFASLEKAGKSWE